MQRSPFFDRFMHGILANELLVDVHSFQRTNITPTFVGTTGYEEVYYIAPKTVIEDPGTLDTIINGIARLWVSIAAPGIERTIDKQFFERLEANNLRCGSCILKACIGKRTTAVSYVVSGQIPTQKFPDDFLKTLREENIFAKLTVHVAPSVFAANYCRKENVDVVDIGVLTNRSKWETYNA